MLPSDLHRNISNTPCCCWGKSHVTAPRQWQTATRLARSHPRERQPEPQAWESRASKHHQARQREGKAAWLQEQTSALQPLFLRAPVRLIHTGAAEQKHTLLVPARDYTWANKPRWSELALSTLVLEARCRQMELGSAKSRYGPGVY